jgi:hypothetical protein
MCDVKLKVPSKQDFFKQMALIVFGTADDDIWGIINGFSRPSNGPKEYLAARVRGFIFSQLSKADKEAFMTSIGHGHDMHSKFGHALVLTKLTAVQRKARDKFLNSGEDQTTANNYYQAVDAIKNVYKYDLLKEKAVK